MRIAVCLKQVPEEACFDRATNTVVREKRGQIVNPSDMHALEMALEIKDRIGATVAAFCMGKPFAAGVLTGAAALGADELFLVSDAALAGSDTFATARALAAAVAATGGADLILCGRRAIDGETGQVGPEMAAMLDIPCLTNVCGLDEAGADFIVCRRLLEESVEVVRLRLPALVTCCDGLEGVTHPRLPGIAGLRRAKLTPVRTLTLADLPGVTVYGAKGSPTRVVETFFPAAAAGECRMWNGTAEAVAGVLEAISPIHNCVAGAEAGS